MGRIINAIVFIGVCIALITGCGIDHKKQEDSKNTIETKYSRLAPFYKDISFDTLDIYAIMSMEDTTFKFRGLLLDSLNVTYLRGKTGKGDIWNYDWDNGWLGCCKFPVDDSLVAFITRIPSYYSSTAIKFFLFDRKRDSVVKVLDLADCFGDAGDEMQYSTGIIKNKDKGLLFLTYTWSSYDHNVENNPKDTITEFWYKYSLCKLEKDRLDTLSRDSATITKGYESLVKRLAGYHY